MQFATVSVIEGRPDERVRVSRERHPELLAVAVMLLVTVFTVVLPKVVLSFDIRAVDLGDFRRPGRRPVLKLELDVDRLVLVAVHQTERERVAVKRRGGIKIWRRTVPLAVVTRTVDEQESDLPLQ